MNRFFPSATDDVIVIAGSPDPHSRTWNDLENWCMRRGTTLRQIYLRVSGLTPSAQLGAKLIEMASAGAPRPSKNADWSPWIQNPKDAERLRQFFHRVISENRRTGRAYYDPELATTLRQLRPDWFTDPVADKKLIIRERARTGEPLGGLKHCFHNYCTCATSKTYDKPFADEIKALRPEWFTSSSSMKKQALLAAARAGDPKPSFAIDRKRAAMFRLYITPGSKVYDEHFFREIVALRPDWVHSITTRQIDKLLAMAEAGAPRPLFDKVDRDCEESILAKALKYLTRRDRVDKGVGAKLRKLAPQWFDEIELGREKAERAAERRWAGRSRSKTVLDDQVSY